MLRTDVAIWYLDGVIAPMACAKAVAIRLRDHSHTSSFKQHLLHPQAQMHRNMT